MDNDLVYFDRRANEERCAAGKSPHAGAREIHLELAQAYEFRLFMLKQSDASEQPLSRFDIADTLPNVRQRRAASRASAESQANAMKLDIIPVQV